MTRHLTTLGILVTGMIAAGLPAGCSSDQSGLVLHKGDAQAPSLDAVSGKGGAAGAGGDAAAAGRGGSGTGGAIGSGGVEATGGFAQTGGSTGTGGATRTGGAPATGGSTPTGGSTGVGGATGSGGTTRTGGSTGAGGATRTGGATGSGGATQTGGATGTGGATRTGGSAGTGGATRTGGITGTGGSAQGGGTTGVGGATRTGGATASGGMTASGGATGTGGTGGKSCGGFVGTGCATGEFCDIQAGLCNAADAGGTCVLKPQVCSLFYLPVCGCDGKTYGNDCARQAAGVSKRSDGACATGTVDAAAGTCGQVTTEAECDSRSDCHSVFVDPGPCNCVPAGCCAYFSRCADGGHANCTGPALCEMMTPYCEAPPYVVSYIGICYEGCVRQSECAGADAATTSPAQN